MTRPMSDDFDSSVFPPADPISDPLPDGHIRVARIVEYIGPKEAVEKQIERSIHGTRILPNRLQIRAETIAEPQKVWVVTCEQAYANSFSVHDVYRNEHDARKAIEGDRDLRVEEFELK